MAGVRLLKTAIGLIFQPGLMLTAAGWPAEEREMTQGRNTDWKRP